MPNSYSGDHNRDVAPYAPQRADLFTGGTGYSSPFPSVSSNPYVARMQQEISTGDAFGKKAGALRALAVRSNWSDIPQTPNRHSATKAPAVDCTVIETS